MFFYLSFERLTHWSSQLVGGELQSQCFLWMSFIVIQAIQAEQHLKADIFWIIYCNESFGDHNVRLRHSIASDRHGKGSWETVAKAFWMLSMRTWHKENFVFTANHVKSLYIRELMSVLLIPGVSVSRCQALVQPSGPQLTSIATVHYPWPEPLQPVLRCTGALALSYPSAELLCFCLWHCHCLYRCLFLCTCICSDGNLCNRLSTFNTLLFLRFA